MKNLLGLDTAVDEMTATLRIKAALVLLAMPGCIKTIDLDAAETGSTSSGDAGESTTTTGASMSTTTQTPDVTTSEDPGTEGTGTTFADVTTDDTGDDTTTGDDVPSVCDPQPQNVPSRLAVAWPEGTEADVVIDASCEVTAYEQVAADEGVLRLLCAEPDGPTARDIEIHAVPFVAPPLDVGDTVHAYVDFKIFTDIPGWTHIAIRDEADELVLGMRDFHEQSELDITAWFAPIAISLDADVCDPEPFELEEPGNFIIEPCPNQVERAAIALSAPFGDALVYDHTIGALGPYDVHVPAAAMLIPQGQEVSCETRPYPSGRVVILRAR